MREPVLDSLWAGGQLFFLKSFTINTIKSINGANIIRLTTANPKPATNSGQNMAIVPYIINAINTPNKIFPIIKHSPFKIY